MGMEFDARCDDVYVTCLAAMPLCYVLSGNAAGNGDVTCDNNVLRLYDGNVACLAAMPLIDVLRYVLTGNATNAPWASERCSRELRKYRTRAGPHQRQSPGTTTEPKYQPLLFVFPPSGV